MLQNIFKSYKHLRICLLTSILLLLLFLLLFSDSVISKIHSSSLVKSCSLCPFKKNATSKNTALLHFTIFNDDFKVDPVNVMLFFVHADRNAKLKFNLNRCISSLFALSTISLHLHILSDQSSINEAIKILEEAAPLVKTATRVSLYDVNTIIKPLQKLIDVLKPHFSYKQGAYYSDRLFYVSIGLYKVIHLKQIILIDIDVKFLNDIKYLYEEFLKFPPEALIGIAREQQPVYRHILQEYRKHHNYTKAGDPPPDGLSGFNSGVLLLCLDKMRNYSLYENIVNNSSIVMNLLKKYNFKGHLGDQDFYTLISFDYPQLFHILPCTWNRQLCEWWRYHGYRNLFDSYHNCSGKINLFHGNCNSEIPVS